MLKVLVDTNVALDAIAAREPFRADAERIFLLAAEEQIAGCLTANSVLDIYYLASKALSDQAAREAVRRLFRIFSVLDVRGADCEAALDSPLPDFEDAVLIRCGRDAQVDCLVTRDEFLIRAADEIPAVSPAAFLRENSFS